MDTKTTLERACLRLEERYRVPGDFKARIREILEPLCRHELDAEEMAIIERALERTYLRHAAQEAEEAEAAATPAESTNVPSEDTPSGVAELVLREGVDSVQPLRNATTDIPRAVTTGVPSSEKGKGGLLLVRIDPKTKTAQLVRLSPGEVKSLGSKTAIADFLKEPDDDTIVH